MWWARQDSNLQPDRYERSDLPEKFEQNQCFSIKIIHIYAGLFPGFLPDNGGIEDRCKPPTGLDQTGPRFVRSGRYRGKSGLGEDEPFR